VGGVWELQLFGAVTEVGASSSYGKEQHVRPCRRLSAMTAAMLWVWALQVLVAQLSAGNCSVQSLGVHILSRCAASQLRLQLLYGLTCSIAGAGNSSHCQYNR
jgi:hypothetical protein